jgi:hypothetical protein
VVITDFKVDDVHRNIERLTAIQQLYLTMTSPGLDQYGHLESSIIPKSMQSSY